MLHQHWVPLFYTCTHIHIHVSAYAYTYTHVHRLTYRRVLASNPSFSICCCRDSELGKYLSHIKSQFDACPVVGTRDTVIIHHIDRLKLLLL